MNNMAHTFVIATAEQANAIAAAAAAYSEAVTRTRSDTSYDALVAELAMLEAIERAYPDTMHAVIADRLVELADTYPDDDEVLEDPSLFHPDAPCQRVYWRGEAA